MSAVPQAREPLVLRDDRDAICTLTMNRPQQMNLLTSAMLEALQAAFDAISEDRGIRVVVLAGSGKGFCAGHDLKEIRALKERPKIEQLFAQCSRMMQTIPALPQRGHGERDTDRDPVARPDGGGKSRPSQCTRSRNLPRRHPLRSRN